MAAGNFPVTDVNAFVLIECFMMIQFVGEQNEWDGSSESILWFWSWEVISCLFHFCDGIYLFESEIPLTGQIEIEME